MCFGAFQYPWIENDDGPDHAVGAYYFRHVQDVSPFKSESYWQRSYLSPYPPLYDMLMGYFFLFIGKISVTLKVINALMVASSTLFGFLFFKEFFKSDGKGLWAAFLITACPAFMSHFIWSQSLAIPLMLGAFWCFLKIEEGIKWLFLSVAFTTLVFLTQPSTAVFMLVMLVPLMYVVDWFKLIGSVMISGVVAGVFHYGPALLVFGWERFWTGIGISTGIFSSGNVDTSGGVVYSLIDIFVAPLGSKIDQATGFGVMLGLLCLVALVMLFVKFKELKTNKNYVLSVFWLLILTLMLEGNALPFKLFPHRVWPFMAVPVVILATFGTWQVINSFSKKWIKAIIFLLIGGLVLLTGAYPKFVVQTSQWTPGSAFSTIQEVQDWVGIKGTLEGNVMMLCSEEEKPISFDLDSVPFSAEIYDFRKQLATTNTVTAYSFMVQKNTSYFVFDHGCIKKFGLEETNRLITEYSVMGDNVVNGDIKVFKLR